MGRFLGVLVWGISLVLFWGEVDGVGNLSFFFLLEYTYLFYLEHFRAAGLMDYNCFHHLLSWSVSLTTSDRQFYFQGTILSMV